MRFLSNFADWLLFEIKSRGPHTRFGAGVTLSVRNDSLRYQGSFSIDDGDDGENVTVKMNLRFFWRAYSNRPFYSYGWKRE